MAAFLRRHSYRGGKPPRSCRPGYAPLPFRLPNCPPTLRAAMVIGTHVRLLRGIQAAIADLETLIEHRVDQCLRAGLPAQLLAEVGPLLDHVDIIDQTAAECDVTPVTKTSGKTSGGAGVIDDHMLSMALHLREQVQSLRDIAARLVITKGKKKGQRPSPAPVLRLLRKPDETPSQQHHPDPTVQDRSQR
ncbi:hypothetical protein [Nocardia brevicatena]|uniref:hypothetical protein n=1 Tax=Nocardia brevicatena TaxID=37327 RepID=UPI0002D4ED38|nr:hypothetical protein [Nocardia brevicatena]